MVRKVSAHLIARNLCTSDKAPPRVQGVVSNISSWALNKESNTTIHLHALRQLGLVFAHNLESKDKSVGKASGKSKRHFHIVRFKGQRGQMQICYQLSMNKWCDTINCITAQVGECHMDQRHMFILICEVWKWVSLTMTAVIFWTSPQQGIYNKEHDMYQIYITQNGHFLWNVQEVQ